MPAISQFKKRKLLDLVSNGEEVCGYCLKVITGKPNCLHQSSRGVVSDYFRNSSFKGVAEKDRVEFVHMRVGMELLLYDDGFIESLPVFDPILVFTDPEDLNIRTSVVEKIKGYDYSWQRSWKERLKDRNDKQKKKGI